MDGKVLDMLGKGVIEPVKLKNQVIKSASEAAEMILRIDDVIAASKPKGPEMPPAGMPPGMPGGY
jgi:chaperonin GroEL (HSP60 family)